MALELSTVKSKPEVSEPEARAQLRRIFSSESFQRSRRLRDFLRFIADLTLEGREEEINEHLIGIEVFGRGGDYNPSEDSVVRRQAHSLRQKLDEYYASAGVTDPVVVEIPLGHYIPTFRPNPSEAAPATAPEAGNENESAGSPSGNRRGRLIAVLLIAAVATILAFAAGRRSVQSETPGVALPLAASPALQELWAAWLLPADPPLICFSSPYTGVVKHYDEPLPPGSEPRRLEVSGELEERFRASLGLQGGNVYISPSITEAKSGEALGAIHLASLFAMNGLRAKGVQSRLLTWENFRRENLILLGHSEQNRWVVPVLEKHPLQLEDTRGSQRRRIVNTEPEDGEPSEFLIDYADDDIEATVEYALVSMLPGLDDRHQLLIISGLNTQATLMGIEFLTDPLRAQSLLDRMREQSPDHSGPWRFQLVLSAEVHDKVPTGGAIELVRVLD